MSASELSKVPAEIVADNDREANDANQTADVTVSNSETFSVKGDWPPALTSAIQQIANHEARSIVDEREARENKRANHRNFNRMMTLLGALVIGLVVSYSLQHDGIPAFGIHLPKSAVGLAPYAFVITVALDSFLALYSFIRHY